MSSFRLAALADSHFNVDNLVGNARAHDSAVEAIAAFGPDLITHAGDLNDRLGVPAEPAVRNEIARLFRSLVEIAPVVVVRGNHDLPGDLDLIEYLGGTFPLYYRDQLDVFEVPLIRDDIPKLLVQCLPWFDKAKLAAGLDASQADKGTTDELTIQAARNLLEILRTEGETARAAGAIVIGVGHIQVGGSVLSNGQQLLGKTVELSPADLARTGAHFWALGHIHKTQRFEQPKTGIAYSGSVERLNFGEPEEKVVLAVELDIYDEPAMTGDRVTQITIDELPTKATKIVRLEPNMIDLGAMVSGEYNPGEDLAGAHVRIRYRGTPEELELVDRVDLEQFFLGLGAAKVQVDPIVERTAAVRSEAITDENLDLEGQTLEWAKATGRTLSPAQVERIRGKIGEIEAFEAGAAI